MELRFLIAALLLVLPLSAAQQWKTIRTANFHLITTASDGEARRTVERFEQVRDFFVRTRPGIVSNKEPVRLVLFRNEKEFRPYAPNEAAAAFYSKGPTGDLIVLQGSTDQAFSIAVHEYMHLLMNHMGLRLPAWLDEGLAELYSTLQPYGGKLSIGIPSPGRVFALNDKWLPLETLTAVDHNSPDYNEKNRAGIFYAQSWLLTHMLSLDKRYSANAGKFLVQVDSGKSTAEALEEVFGLSLKQAERELNLYYRSNSINAALFDTKLQKVKAMETVEPADPANVEVQLAAILTVSGRRNEAVEHLRAAATAYPESAEVYECLALVAGGARDSDEARQYLGKAVQLNPGSARLWWNYARTLYEKPEESDKLLQALRRTTELDPAHNEARLLLANVLYMRKQYGESLVALNGMTRLTREEAPRVFLAKAYTALRLNMMDDAKSAAESAKKHATEKTDIASAERVLQYIEDSKRPRPATAPAEPVAAAQSAAAPEQITDTAAIPLEQKPEVILTEIRGILRKVECTGFSARLHVAVRDVILQLLIPNPDEVTISNQPGSTVTMSCGDQNPAPGVIIGYVPRPDAKEKTEGDVRALEFTAR